MLNWFRKKMPCSEPYPEMTKRQQLVVSELEQIGMRRGMYCRAAQIAARMPTDKPGSMQYRWILTTENPVLMFDWERWELWPEVLLTEGMLPVDQVPLLDNHRRISVKDMLGSVADFDRTEVDGVAATAGQVTFSTTAAAVSGVVAEGHLTDGSVGYMYRKTDAIYIPQDMTVNVAGRDFVGPVKVVTQWRLLEFSLTPIGADVFAKIQRLLTQEQNV